MSDPRKKWVLALLLFATLGVVFAGILTVEHFMQFELPGCSKTGAFDCSAVNSSKYSELRGIPIAFIGLVNYILVWGLCFTRLRKGPEKAAGSMAYAVVLAVLSVAFSAFLFYISKNVLGKFCLYCILLYVVNLGLLVTSLLAVGGPAEILPSVERDLESMGKQRPLAYGLMALILVLFGVAIFKPGELFNSPRLSAAPLVKNSDDIERQMILQAPFMNPGPGSGYAKGAANPVLTIVEFADLECPACQATSWVLGEFAKAHKDEVRVIFRHYPLDMKCNPGVKRVIHEYACAAAIASEAAGLQGRFWEFHDAVYAKNDNIFGPTGRPDLSPPALLQRAKNIGLDTAEFERALKNEATGETSALLDKILADIVDGDAFGVGSTPTLFVNGRLAKGGGKPRPTLELWLRMAKEGELDPKGPRTTHP